MNIGILSEEKNNRYLITPETAKLIIQGGNNIFFTTNIERDYHNQLTLIKSSEFNLKEKFKDLNDINFRLEKNDKIVQSGNTRDMIYDIDTLIAHVSQFMTLKIGDILFTGTPAGVGPVAIDDRLKGYLEDEPIFTVNIK